MPSSRALPNPGLKPRSPTLQADSLPAELPGKPKNTGVGRLYLLQGIFPTQEWNQGLLHCRQNLYQLRHQRSPHSLFISFKSSSTVPDPMLGAKGTKTRNAGHICCILADSVDMSRSKLRSW